MHYWIYIKDRNGEAKVYEKDFLPGIMIPEMVVPMLKAEWVVKHFPKWCHECGLDCHCHPIAEDGSKFCTVLFHDAMKPPWRIEDVI